jgi:hypothetical protein
MEAGITILRTNHRSADDHQDDFTFAFHRSVNELHFRRRARHHLVAPPDVRMHEKYICFRIVLLRQDFDHSSVRPDLDFRIGCERYNRSHLLPDFGFARSHASAFSARAIKSSNFRSTVSLLLTQSGCEARRYQLASFSAASNSCCIVMPSSAPRSVSRSPVPGGPRHPRPVHRSRHRTPDSKSTSSAADPGRCTNRPCRSASPSCFPRSHAPQGFGVSGVTGATGTAANVTDC